MYASSKRASSFAAPCTSVCASRVASCGCGISTAGGACAIASSSATSATRACRPARGRDALREGEAPVARATALTYPLADPTTVAAAPAGKPREDAPRRVRLVPQIGARRLWRAATPPDGRHGQRRRRSAMRTFSSTSSRRSSSRIGSCTFASGIGERRLDVEGERHALRRRRASCSRCRSARRAGAGPRPTGCAGWPASRSCGPCRRSSPSGTSSALRPSGRARRRCHGGCR